MVEEFSFPYGDSFLKADIPAGNLSFVLEKRQLEGIRDEAQAITNSLRWSIGGPPLNERFQADDRIVVLVTDNTRACPDDRLLPPILAELEQKTARENITIVIALGLHPPLDKNALVKKLGREIVENYRVVNHDSADTLFIGNTSRGTPVEVNRLVYEADFRLSTGFVEPHFFAGFSGGRKSAAPGVMGVRTIRTNHRYEMISHPLARTGVLKGNPVHEDLVEQAAMAKLNFIVNVLLNRKGEITHVAAGDPVEAHEKACLIEGANAEVRIAHEVDITITTNSGAPLDLDLYQTCKGIENASRITRQGGIIIIASACNEGGGPEAFLKLHRAAASPAEALERSRLEDPLGVQWQNQILARSQLKNDIYLVSGLQNSLVESMMMKPVKTINQGLEMAFSALGREARVAVIPQGPLVMPVLDES